MQDISRALDRSRDLFSLPPSVSSGSIAGATILPLVLSDRGVQLPAPKREQIEVVLSSYRSMIPDLAYLSMPITSGRRMYDLMAGRGVSSFEELCRAPGFSLSDDLIKPNIAAGVDSARSIAGRSAIPVIAPSVFEARSHRWSQDEYMVMWLSMIEEKVVALGLTAGWEFSNGGAEEYLHAVQMQAGFKSRNAIRIFDEVGAPVELHDGVQKLGSALMSLHERGFKSQRIAEVFTGLMGIVAAHRLEPFSRHEPFLERVQPGFADFKLEEVLSVMREVAPLLETEYKLHPYHAINLDRGIQQGGVVRRSESFPAGVQIVETRLDNQ